MLQCLQLLLLAAGTAKELHWHVWIWLTAAAGVTHAHGGSWCFPQMHAKEWQCMWLCCLAPGTFVATMLIQNHIFAFLPKKIFLQPCVINRIYNFPQTSPTAHADQNNLFERDRHNFKPLFTSFKVLEERVFGKGLDWSSTTTWNNSQLHGFNF